jgi:hypothetical protein
MQKKAKQMCINCMHTLYGNKPSVHKLSRKVTSRNVIAQKVKRKKEEKKGMPAAGNPPKPSSAAGVCG